jgi:hypothetical protein
MGATIIHESFVFGKEHPKDIRTNHHRSFADRNPQHTGPEKGVSKIN